MFICKYCKEEKKNLNSLRQHEVRCKSNPDRKVPVWDEKMRKKHSGLMKVKNTNGDRIYSDEYKIRMSAIAKQVNKSYWTDENKKIHSDNQKEFVKNNPELYNRVCGRAKVFEVLNSVGLLLKVRGSWEQLFVEWCNSKNILCQVPNISFEYNFEGNKRMYFPDFYLPEYNLWVEIKGYETNKDRAKWINFPHELLVFKKKEINLIRNNEFKLEDYIAG